MSPTTSKSYDVAIVGAGIVGLAHAWMAAARGQRVVLLERSPQAVGASIRNFGMVWPIGQPAGELHQLAMRSRELWLQLAAASDVWANPCGSLHLAHRPDELSVLQEYVEHCRGSDISVEMLSPAETLERTPAAKPEGLLGAMWSATELCVNPPAAIRAIPHWLKERYGVELRFETLVNQVAPGVLRSGGGLSWQAERIVICSGSDFQTLLPDAFAGAGLRLCKLHMLRTATQADAWRIGPHLASGLTLRHYSAFAACPSLEELRRRVREETPELDRFGIHVMASQNELGQVVLGDSHEYDAEISPFDRSEIDQLMLRELQRQFALPDWNIESRWHGVYAKHPTQVMLEQEVQEGVHVCVGPGGAGMTMSFGVADRFWKQLTGQEVVL
ncbi:TIGR03364 family FAD-dependent oxidoreductase [Aureliella helgolandensis]|uniref:Monomeric sarcosine oxidase n=1 Tax=Aureliella helgolandensis TaxID=2527968 RepID=A0A518GGS8_9BACT|nr:TIGR03364 family FAD-dependent oxidoreductase [Aureliella helgolandensis]QDV27802.1 Monomeric sarcosine oxidase [Aureliella helgolandensis]